MEDVLVNYFRFTVLLTTSNGYYAHSLLLEVKF